MASHSEGVRGDESDIVADNASWTFDIDPTGFEEHIRRSVPFYREGHGLVAALSDFFLPPSAVVFDIGCTTGATTRAILERHPDRDMRIVGLDVVPAMVDFATRQTPDTRAEFECANALEYDYPETNLFVLYYTLQFIHPSIRIDLLRRIHERLCWGGGLIVFEKVRAPDARFQDYLSQLYVDFKLDNRFTPDQVVNKQRSLKGVLEPFSERGNLTLFTEAGFKDVVSVFKWVCFEGWLAIK
ncbi:MAG: methyltransferase domain-containing protein [Proteobacteria bacterium]|nr:MAG: methyltransferase domain-containing protein [Pseudomonadota bacterium]